VLLDKNSPGLLVEPIGRSLLGVKFHIVLVQNLSHDEARFGVGEVLAEAL
jgi:hypothetical protein